jgi:CheY-like chemotaxis protein
LERVCVDYSVTEVRVSSGTGQSRVVLLEDDYIQVENLVDFFVDHYPSVDLVVVQSERDFRFRMAEFGVAPPDLFILDVMVPWTDYSEELGSAVAPSEVVEGGPFGAGLRCLQLLLASPRLGRVPVIVLSVMERTVDKEVPEHVLWLQKPVLRTRFEVVLRSVLAATDGSW